MRKQASMVLFNIKILESQRARRVIGETAVSTLLDLMAVHCDRGDVRVAFSLSSWALLTCPSSNSSPCSFSSRGFSGVGATHFGSGVVAFTITIARSH
jgi:hypothetical protein